MRIQAKNAGPLWLNEAMFPRKTRMTDTVINKPAKSIYCSKTEMTRPGIWASSCGSRCLVFIHGPRKTFPPLQSQLLWQVMLCGPPHSRRIFICQLNMIPFTVNHRRFRVHGVLLVSIVFFISYGRNGPAIVYLVFSPSIRHSIRSDEI